jgi:hypothetical protein
MSMPTSTAVERYQPTLTDVEESTLLGYLADVTLHARRRGSKIVRAWRRPVHLRPCHR